MAASGQEREDRAPVSSDLEKAEAELMRTLGLHPPAHIAWDGRNLVVEAKGQVLPERPTVWAGRYPIIYRP
ncbi:MAG: hypothetical protein ACREE1_12105 [Stellaceae bacterium]